MTKSNKTHSVESVKVFQAHYRKRLRRVSAIVNIADDHIKEGGGE